MSATLLTNATAISTVTTAASTTALLPPAASLLDQLLESTKSLPRTVTGLGSIQLGINEIAGRARALRERIASNGTEGDTKAHYLLAASGINAEDIAQDLDTVELRTTIEPVTYTSETDIKGFLRYKREENIIASIEDSVRQTTKKFDLFIAQNIRLDWNYEKLLVCEHFGLVPRGTAAKLSQELGFSGQASHVPLSSSSSLSSLTATTSVDAKTKSLEQKNVLQTGWKKGSIGRSVLGPVSGVLEFSDVGNIDLNYLSSSQQQQQQQQVGLLIQNRQERYAKVVSALNAYRLEHRPVPLIDALADVVKSWGTDTRSQQLYDSWASLSYVIPNDTPERKFGKSYIESADDSSQGIQVRNMIRNGSRKYLEAQFFKLIETEIAKYPQEAQLGGIPSVINKVQAFLKLRFMKNGIWIKQNLEVVNNIPIWALLYYLLRSGHMQDALEFTVQFESIFQKIERGFPAYLKAYAKSGDDRRLPRELAERLQAEFNHHIRAYDPKTDDPFKFALYKIIGRCELNRKQIPQVVLVTEDWLWVQLALVQEPTGAADVFSGVGTDAYTLNDLRNMVVQFGAKHFNPKGSNPVVYFQILLLTGQYERAIHYLYKFHAIDAVHFAIALAYYGLLRVSDDTTSADVDLLTLDSAGRPEINFARLVGYYTRDFRRTDPEVAVDYISLICLNGDVTTVKTGKQQLKLCHEALRELVLETRDFAELLGDVRADGTREAGIIERKMELIKISDEKQYLRTITEQAAVQADQDGRTADAVLLYHLSEEYDVVVSIINKTLGESLAIADMSRDEIGAGVSMSLIAAEDPVQLARNMMTVYSNNGEILKRVSARNRETCGILLQIVDARRAFDAGKPEECLENIAKVNVLPVELDNDTGSIRRRAQQFGELDENVARNVPALLVLAMECCLQVTRELDGSAYGDASRSKKTGELRRYAKNCMIYAGMIQYRMPREVYGRLTRMETEL
ncbi:Nup93/Nic96-domain-containing protein [Lipomyces japonicus]|uniref:Nup93/Nic96-domain-containing protein n=1 Tax=Lipomyces japonicus TaxID=56871 RepID=UPI0034CFB039